MFTKVLKQTSKFTSMVESQSQNFATKAPKRVAVTGAAGQIGYATLFRIASGQMLGADQPVILHLIDIPAAQDSLNGVKMELNDCSFSTLAGVVCTDSLTTGFKDVDFCLLVGAKPRGPGMERGDLLKDNGKIFIDQGKAINDNANRNVKTVVVGNPANTNCMIAAHYAKDLPKSSFTAMTRLDHNRALYQLSDRTNTHIDEISKLCIWGNHSPTMYPDLHSCTVAGKPALSLVDQTWVDGEFLPTVQQRGAAIIKARKLSSAASAGSSAIDHIHDWEIGTNGSWTSMAVTSNGEYGVPKGLVYSYPVTCNNGNWEIVQGLTINAEQQRRLDVTTAELESEREAVSMYLN